MPDLGTICDLTLWDLYTRLMKPENPTTRLAIITLSLFKDQREISENDKEIFGTSFPYAATACHLFSAAPTEEPELGSPSIESEVYMREKALQNLCVP